MTTDVDSGKMDRALDFYRNSILETETKAFIIDEIFHGEEKLAEELWTKVKLAIVERGVKRIHLNENDDAPIVKKKEEILEKKKKKVIPKLTKTGIIGRTCGLLCCLPILCGTICCGVCCLGCALLMRKKISTYIAKKSVSKISPKITFEPMDFHKEKKACQEKGTLFEDQLFDTVFDNIFQTKDDGKKQIVWKRPKEISDNPQFFSDGHSRFDIKQGCIGDCWLLSGLASLTLHDDLFYNVVPKDQDFGDGYAGIFHFRFWRYGEWVDVVIDDRLPTIQGKLIFMKSNDENEFWSALFYGSYQHLEGGTESEAYRIFTGGATDYITLAGVEENARSAAWEYLFDTLEPAMKRGCMYSCSMMQAESDDSKKRRNGIYYGHAYTITGCGVFNMKNSDKKYKLVRMRNPHGEGEWIGDFADNSFFWEMIDSDPEDHSKDDGEFWMPLEDFTTNFNVLEEGTPKISDYYVGNETEKYLQDGPPMEETKFEGAWKVSDGTAAGCFDFDNYCNNPKYLLRVAEAAPDVIPVLILLVPKYLRERSLAEYGMCKSACLYVWKKIPTDSKITAEKLKNLAAKAEEDEKKPKDEEDGMSHTREDDLCSFRDRHVSMLVRAGHSYVIMPTMLEERAEGEYLLRIFHNGGDKITVTKIEN